MTAIDSSKTVAILLGASQWPAAPGLDSEVFLRSKRRLANYLLDSAGLGLSTSQVLDLFDTKLPSTGIYDRISKFLETDDAKQGSDLLLYFVGHGDFAGDSREYVLLIQASDPSQLETTALKAADLAARIRKTAPGLLQHLVIDACFAAAAQASFYGTAVSNAVQALRQDTVEMLCSSGMVLSVAPRNQECTPFTSAILDVLMLGSGKEDPPLTLKKVGALAEHRIRDTFGERAAIPQHLPLNLQTKVVQRTLFPNTAASVQFCVLLSDSARGALKAHPLRQTANTMTTGFKGELREAAGNLPLAPTRFLESGQALRSVPEFLEAVRVICRSDVAVFDLTNYEPAAMLLLGIRSVARRGVTVCVTATTDIDAGDSPFYFKDIKLVSYAPGAMKPELQMKNLISEGLKLLREAPLQYLDLPSFDAIRQVWPDEKYRQSLQYFNHCLVLCSYSQAYRDNSWPRVFERLVYGIRDVRDRDDSVPSTDRATDPRVVRSIDVTSPRLVSLALFDAIRRTEFCIVDLTEWRPNVLFELGVRLAATDLDPICILDSTVEAHVAPSAGVSRQRQDLLSLLTSHEYQRDDGSDNPVAPFTKMLENHLDIRGQRYVGDSWEAGGRLRPGSIYTAVWQYINRQHEPVATSVWKYLADTERLYHVSDSKGRSPFIYPSTHTLTARAEEHGRECLVAAVLYLQHRYGESELQKNPELQKQFLEFADRVAGMLLESPGGWNRDLGIRLAQMTRNLRGESLDSVAESGLALERVKVLRGLGQFADALTQLEPSIRALDEELRSLEKTDLEPFQIERRNLIAAKLANCYGVSGGLLRRMGKLPESLQGYQSGRKIEQRPDYGISDSYNLVNELVLEILTKSKTVGDPDLSQQIADAISIIEKQVQGTRRDQWWAWADLGMLRILADRVLEAESAYKSFWEAGARDTDFGSSQATLLELRNVLGTNQSKVRQTIDEMLQKIPQLKPA